MAIPRGSIPREPLTTGGIPFLSLPGHRWDARTFLQSVGGATVTPAGALGRAVAFTCSVGGATLTAVGVLVTNIIFGEAVGGGTVTPEGTVTGEKGVSALVRVLLRISGRLRGLWNKDVD